MFSSARGQAEILSRSKATYSKCLAESRAAGAMSFKGPEREDATDVLLGQETLVEGSLRGVAEASACGRYEDDPTPFEPQFVRDSCFQAGRV